MMRLLARLKLIRLAHVQTEPPVEMVRPLGFQEVDRLELRTR